jgi:hypothetical protein
MSAISQTPKVNTAGTLIIHNVNLLIAAALLAAVVVFLTSFVDSPAANVDSATHSYTAWAQAAEAEASTADSATRSYIAQARAVACSVDATYGLDLDSATRSYIAWGLAFQAQNDIGALCR